MSQIKKRIVFVENNVLHPQFLSIFSSIFDIRLSAQKPNVSDWQEKKIVKKMFLVFSIPFSCKLFFGIPT